MQRIQSDRKYEFDVEFTIKSRADRSHGFGIMLTAEESGFPFPFSPEIGYRRDFKGLGVFLYKELNTGDQWVSFDVITNLSCSTSSQSKITD